MASVMLAHLELEERIRAILYGQAIGDAIGLLTEFMHKSEVSKYYGHLAELEYEHKVQDMHRARWDNGDWTDDTDQMILIMLSIIEQNGTVLPTDYAAKLKRWAQRGFPELGDYGGMGLGATTSNVLRHQKFLSDPHAAAEDVWVRSGREVAPNGGVMRTSVLGVFQYDTPTKVHENTLAICKVTHTDPRCQASTVAVTTAIALMLLRNERHLKKDGSYNIDEITKEAYDTAKTLITNNSHKKEFKKAIFATKLKELDLSEHGKIGYTLKCMGCGFWALRQNDFRSALQELIMEGGDADTNGAVAGAMLGCKLGLSGLPATWLGGLIHKEWLDKIIDRFLPLVIPTYVRKFEDSVVEGDEGPKLEV